MATLLRPGFAGLSNWPASVLSRKLEHQRLFAVDLHPLPAKRVDPGLGHLSANSYLLVCNGAPDTQA